MNLFIATFIIMLLAVAGMAIGTLLGRRSIQGSCGGLSSVKGLENSCGICGEPCEKRRKALQDAKKSDTK